jgi:hypothetical protein
MTEGHRLRKLQKHWMKTIDAEEYEIQTLRNNSIKAMVLKGTGFSPYINHCQSWGFTVCGKTQ